MTQPGKFSLMVHGGAGTLANVKDEKMALRYVDSIRNVLERGREVMQLGGSALQAVETCAALLEDDSWLDREWRGGASQVLIIFIQLSEIKGMEGLSFD